PLVRRQHLVRLPLQSPGLARLVGALYPCFGPALELRLVWNGTLDFVLERLIRFRGSFDVSARVASFAPDFLGLALQTIQQLSVGSRAKQRDEAAGHDGCSEMAVLHDVLPGRPP